MGLRRQSVSLPSKALCIVYITKGNNAESYPNLGLVRSDNAATLIDNMNVYLDSASELPPRRLRRLAKKAHRTRQHSASAFERLVQSSGVSPRQLRLLADAWAAGGTSGVEALSPASGNLSEAALKELDQTLENWRRRHYPLETLQWEVWRNRMTVWQVVPGLDRLGPVERIPVLQLRHTKDEGWHLYRKAAQGEWWPVIVSAATPTALDECLDTVRLDVARQFWAPPRSYDRLPRRPR